MSDGDAQAADPQPQADTQPEDAATEPEPQRQGSAPRRQTNVAAGVALTAEHSRKYGLDMAAATRISARIIALPPPVPLLMRLGVSPELVTTILQRTPVPTGEIPGATMMQTTVQDTPSLGEAAAEGAKAGMETAAATAAEQRAAESERVAARSALLDEWREAALGVVADLDLLHDAVLGSDAPEKTEIARRVSSLGDLLLLTPNSAAKATALRKYLTEDPYVTAVEGSNEFSVEVAVKRPLLPVLDKMIDGLA